jgi:hypothetical protein
VEELFKELIEPAQTVEACRDRNFRHGHLSFVDEVLGEEYATGLRYGDWRGSEMLEEEPSQLPLADSQAFGECLNGFIFAVERTVGDEGHGS